MTLTRAEHLLNDQVRAVVMPNFRLLCEDVTLFFEGGLSDNKNDPGGLTNFGITQKLVDELKLGFDVRSLTKPDAIVFYRIWFWEFFHCDLLSDLVVATKVFDMLVNVTGHAVAMVQSAVNQLYQSQVVVVDGRLGVHTAYYINRIEQTQMRRFLVLIKQEQRAFYLEQIKKRPSDKEFEFGWLRRAYWPFSDDLRPWPYLPHPGEGWLEGV
jgi:lysozyme family protein